MQWILQLLVTVWLVANDYARYAVDPAVHFSIAQVNCTLPTTRCLQLAKSFHVQQVKDSHDLYWRTVHEENARVEQERAERKAHNDYIAAQLAKGDKWDRNEMSPPTINIFNNFNNFMTVNIDTLVQNNLIIQTFITPTTVSAPPAPSKPPAVDERVPAATQRPSVDSRPSLDTRALDWAYIMVDIKQIFGSVILLYIIICIFKLLYMLIALGERVLHRDQNAPQDPPAPNEAPQAIMPTAAHGKTNPLKPSHVIKSALTHAEDPASTSEAAEEEPAVTAGDVEDHQPAAEEQDDSWKRKCIP